MNERWRGRRNAGGWHFLCSVGVALAVAAVVYGLWFPGSYAHMAGGTGLLLTIVAVDVVIGPLLTFLIFDVRKPRSYLVFDISVISIFQAVALAYGIYSVFLARPVHLVFEGDRFRVISAAEVIVEELPDAPPSLQKLPLSGPQLIAVRRSSSTSELLSSLNTAIADGVDTSQRPSYWEPYGAAHRKKAAAAARPVSLLSAHYAADGSKISKLLMDIGLDPATAKYLPVRAKHDSTAIINDAGEILIFLPYDPFALD